MKPEFRVNIDRTKNQKSHRTNLVDVAKPSIPIGISYQQKKMAVRKGIRTHSFPLKIGFPDKSSAKMQPILQTSIAVVYCLYDSMISGALYHLVATYSVKGDPPCAGESAVSGWNPLASPKSQIFN